MEERERVRERCIQSRRGRGEMEEGKKGGR